MDRKQKILIGFSTVYAVLLILLSLSLLYYAFVFLPNKYSEYAIEPIPIAIEIESVGDDEYKVENQIFKRVSLPNSDFFGIGVGEFAEILNSEKKDIYMVDNQIFIKYLEDNFLLFFIDSNYFYINIDVCSLLDNQVAASRFSVFIDVLNDINNIDPDDIQQFMNDLQSIDRSVTVILLPLILEYLAGDNRIMWDKPIIYLYPTEKTDIQVNLDTIDFTTTYPQYNDGWSVTAYPDGTLIDKSGREYNYLYWEGLSKNFVDLSKGFVIEKKNYINFLETTLLGIGMIDTEINDFISYWLPQMNEYGYCFVSFQMENYEEAIQLKYSVQPDNELRVFAVFCGLNEPIDVETQDLSYYDDFVREGFVVVEWGGTFLDNLDNKDTELYIMKKE